MFLLLLSFDFVLSLVELLQVLGVDLLEHLVWEKSEERPGDVERLEDISGIIGSLSQELSFESLEELKIESIVFSQGFLTDDGLHGLCVFTDGVEGIELVGDLRVINSSETLTDSRLHETR